MVIKNINLETVCGITSVLPENDKPEIAFAGKSNVGKSSLINALMNRKSYARISATPGKTQTINFYTINEEMYLVDLPGYGYAKVSEQEKIQWGKLIERYLHTSKASLRQLASMGAYLSSSAPSSFPYPRYSVSINSQISSLPCFVWDENGITFVPGTSCRPVFSILICFCT